MTRRHRNRRLTRSPVVGTAIAACTPNEIVRCCGTENEAPAATADAAAPLREVCPVLEPWAVDESVCSEHALPPHEAIEARAREIWELRGRPTGADLDIWLEAQGQFVSAMR
jgi:hypothetical protein